MLPVVLGESSGAGRHRRPYGIETALIKILMSSCGCRWHRSRIWGGFCTCWLRHKTRSL